MSDKVKKEIFNSVNENVQALAKLFPSVVKDGEVDFDALKEELGEFVEVGAEKYDFTWAGKSKAKAEARDSGEGLTLKLKVGEGVNEDTTQNIYIEGDNLKALKLLRNSYYGAIKMIYIDPPYNTGKDFVYRDNFTLSQEELDELGNNLDEEGNRLEKNSGDSARYHTDWLNMMYSRLKVASDLLSDDGAIFVSIDDNEQANTIKICDEIFGEKNYITTIPRLTSAQRPSQEKYISIQHDYLIVYVKNRENENCFARTIVRSGLENAKKDNIGLYFEGDTSPILASSTQGYSKGGDYDFEYKGIVYKPIASDGTRRRWLWTIDRMKAAADLGILVPTKTGLRVQNYINKEFQLKTNVMVDKDTNLILATYDFMASKFANNHGTASLSNLDLTFSFAKPVELIKEIAKLIKDKNGIFLDFFSGAATTAQAICELNVEDGGCRQFIMIQLPEKDDNVNIDGKNTICDLGKERIRRAGAKIKTENGLTAPNLDIGFKVFEVAETNIRMFSEEMKGNDLFDIMQQTDKELRDFMPETKDIDVCYELLLRHRGVALSSSIENLDIGERTYIIADSIVVCLDSEVTEEMVEKLAVIDPQPMKYIFRDSAFGDDISLKENTMIMLSALIEKTTGESKKAYKVEFI